LAPDAVKCCAIKKTQLARKSEIFGTLDLIMRKGNLEKIDLVIN